MMQKMVVTSIIILIIVDVLLVAKGAENNALTGVIFGGLIGIGGGVAIEHLRAKREEKFRRQDRAMAIAKSISKNIFHIQNTNYSASISGKITTDLNQIAMKALADLEESRAIVSVFLGEKADNAIADITPLLSKVVGEIHERRGTDFEIKDCPSFLPLVDKHSEIMQILQDYAEGKQ